MSELERNKRYEMNEVGISAFSGDEWVQGRHLADGLGILLQLDALSMLEKLGCKPV